MIKKEINSKGHLVVKHYKREKVDQITEITDFNLKKYINYMYISVKESIREVEKGFNLAALENIEHLEELISEN